MTTNPRNIVWPQDNTGFLYGLKNAGIKAVERQMGNPEKHEALMQVLETLALHAKARFALQAEIRAARISEAAGPVLSEPAKDTAPVVVPDPAPADKAADPIPAAIPDKPQATA